MNNFYPAVIQRKKRALEDTYIFRCIFEEKEKLRKFLPGQYVYLANPAYKNPHESHPFSIASSPLEENYLEFCIKVYGSWTQEFVKKNTGDTIYISHPTGNFIWNPKITDAVFLLGGIGISPIMSMLRFIKETHKKPSSIMMLYGNRTPETIAYKKELEALQKSIPDFTIVHIFSHISDSHQWNGYRGFITREIIEQEVNLTNEPTFFIVGPPVFLHKMNVILEELSVKKSNFKTEDISSARQENTLLSA